MLFTLWGQYFTWHYVVSTMRSIISRDIMLFTPWCEYYHVALCSFHYEDNIITWQHVVSHYEVNIITWHYVVHTMRSIIMRSMRPIFITWHYVVSTMMSILSRDIMLFPLWGQNYHVMLCCSQYEVNIITWHYVVHTMSSILSRDIMLFTLWGEYYHVTLCCSQYEVNIITWHYVVHNMR